jgi:hypothetical protein
VQDFLNFDLFRIIELRGNSSKIFEFKGLISKIFWNKGLEAVLGSLFWGLGKGRGALGFWRGRYVAFAAV